MDTHLPEYELYAIRYAERDARRSDHFIGGDPHDGPMPMDYFVWVAAASSRANLTFRGAGLNRHPRIWHGQAAPGAGFDGGDEREDYTYNRTHRTGWAGRGRPGDRPGNTDPQPALHERGASYGNSIPKILYSARVKRRGLLMADVKIDARPNGPYVVTGSIELRDTNGNVLATQERTVLCRCGASTTKPFCDGTHSKIGFQAAAQAVPDSAEKS